MTARATASVILSSSSVTSGLRAHRSWVQGAGPLEQKMICSLTALPLTVGARLYMTRSSQPLV